MAHQRALLLLLAISCGNYNVQSFSFVPGASPSRGWSGASCIFARNAPVFARNVGDGAGRDSAGHVACLSATRAAVSAESGEYLESKEALKKVGFCSCFPVTRRSQVHILAVLTWLLLETFGHVRIVHMWKSHSRSTQIHDSDDINEVSHVR